jgi:hypothetical protein
VVRELGNGAGKFDAGGARADDRERQQRIASYGIAFALGALEGDQNVPSQRGRIFQRLQARRELLPFVMAEISVAHAGGENQRVVRHGVAAFEQHAAVCCINASHCGEKGRNLRTVAQQVADRPGNLGGRKRRGRNLIEQRLEQMMVASVDQRDRNGRALEPIGGFQSAEAGADDHYAMRIWQRRGHGKGPLLVGDGFCSILSNGYLMAPLQLSVQGRARLSPQHWDKGLHYNSCHWRRARIMVQKALSRRF